MKLGNLQLYSKGPIHIVGIGGIGMSCLAKLLHQKNIKVQGSDLNNNLQTKELRKLGIKVFIRHSHSNVSGCCLVARSSAISNHNVEIKESTKQGIPVISRAELLSNILLYSYNICITGAHGKTSTTSYVYSILKSARFNPAIICGGIINSINSNFSQGDEKIRVVEADESDGTFLILPTNISIITNIDTEHLDYYGNLSNMINIYKLFIEKSLFKDLVIACNYCQNLQTINQQYLNHKKYITYGIHSKNSDISAINLHTVDQGIRFDILLSKKCQQTLNQTTDIIKQIMIKDYGEHNVLNSLAAIAVYLFKGGDKALINNALQLNNSVRRRFTTIGKVKKITFIDDYAHHPNEIKATLNVAKVYSDKIGGKIVAIFEPHKYSRFKDLYTQFLTSFNDADYLIVLDIYSAGEDLITNITSQTFSKDIKYNIPSYYCKNHTEVEDKVSSFLNTECYVVFMGAGNISDIANKVFNNLSATKDC